MRHVTVLIGHFRIKRAVLFFGVIESRRRRIVIRDSESKQHRTIARFDLLNAIIVNGLFMRVADQIGFGERVNVHCRNPARGIQNDDRIKAFFFVFYLSDKLFPPALGFFEHKILRVFFRVDRPHDFPALCRSIFQILHTILVYARRKQIRRVFSLHPRFVGIKGVRVPIYVILYFLGGNLIIGVLFRSFALENPIHTGKIFRFAPIIPVSPKNIVERFVIAHFSVIGSRKYVMRFFGGRAKTIVVYAIFFPNDPPRQIFVLVADRFAYIVIKRLISSAVRGDENRGCLVFIPLSRYFL